MNTNNISAIKLLQNRISAGKSPKIFGKFSDQEWSRCLVLGLPFLFLCQVMVLSNSHSFFITVGGHEQINIHSDVHRLEGTS